MPDKTDLVLVPGLLCTSALWAPQVGALDDVAKIMIADHTRHDSMVGIASSILAAAPDRFALAGLSMGGYIAFEIVRQAPDRVTRLALLDTSARADTPESSARRRKLIAAAEAEGVGRALDILLPALVHKDRLSDEALTDCIRQMALDTGIEAFKRQQAAIIGRPDSRPLLKSTRCPTLVVVGAEDALTPVDLSEEIAAGLPDARLEVIPHCGHISTLEQPEAVNQALRAWLTAHPFKNGSL